MMLVRIEKSKEKDEVECASNGGLLESYGEYE